MQALFGTAAVGFEVWWRVILLGVVVLLAVELEKWVIRRMRRV
jgi:hypothetical protein